MEATRAYWGSAGVGLFLVGLALVLARPVLLLGAAGVGGWLVARQSRFLRQLSNERAGWAIEQSLDRDHVHPDESVTVSLSIARPAGAPLGLALTSAPPAAAAAPTADERTVTLDPGQREAAVSYPLSLPVAGQFTVESPAVEVRSPDGLVGETVVVGPSRSLLVDPRSPREIHVGSGGEPVAAAFGGHAGGRLGSGLDPAELRSYQPGDPADRIDWKATARQGEPFVREFEAEKDRETVLVVDHRAALGVGPDGETALDYLRQVALAWVESARRQDDPLGWYAVGDEGVTETVEPAAAPASYRAIRSALHGLSPTPATDRTRPPAIGSPAAARRTADRLGTDETAYGATLRPYLASADPYVERARGEPLVETVRRHVAEHSGNRWIVLFTDDTAPAGVREAVKLGRRGTDHVVVYLAPSVLYEAGGLADLERAYERYAEFESFRRELSRLARVDAYEVAPGDRLSAVLAAGRRRRAASGVEA